MVVQGHPRSLIYFGTNRKRVCNLILVINSNLGPIVSRFRDIAGFLLRARPHPYFTRILGVPLGLDRGATMSEANLLIE